jgi:hypothetical protein
MMATPLGLVHAEAALAGHAEEKNRQGRGKEKEWLGRAQRSGPGKTSRLGKRAREEKKPKRVLKLKNHFLFLKHL